MKYRLLAGTALTSASFLLSPPADAAERLNVVVGGFMEQWFGYSDNDQDRFDGFDEQTDTEIHFNGSAKLDNGIEFGINVQLEGQSGSDQIDEQWLYVEGAFGRLLMGSENGAHYLMHYAPPDAGIGLNTGDVTNWIPNTTGASTFDGIVATFARSADNDSEKITYLTPRLDGFQFGISYVPEFTQDDDAKPDDTATGYEDGVSLGLNYDRAFDDLRVRASAGAFWADAKGLTPNDLATYNFGLRFGYRGLELAGAWAMYDKGNAGVTRSLAGDVYHLGAMYKTGPYSTSFAYMRGEQAGLSGGGDDTFEAVMLSGGYNLGPGIDFKASALWGDWRAENVAGGGTDNEGYGLVAGFDLSF